MMCFIAIDEFTWNRRTQPNLLRRKIIDMSISDELGIFYFFLISIPVNLGNEVSLVKLQEALPHMDVNIIAGEDSLINNDAYWDKGNKIFELDHILFEREVAVEENKNKITEHLEWFSGDVRIEKLPRKFESISSKQIRRNIDKGGYFRPYRPSCTEFCIRKKHV